MLSNRSGLKAVDFRIGGHHFSYIVSCELNVPARLSLICNKNGSSRRHVRWFTSTVIEIKEAIHRLPGARGLMCWIFQWPLFPFPWVIEYKLINQWCISSYYKNYWFLYISFPSDGSCCTSPYSFNNILQNKFFVILYIVMTPFCQSVIW